MNGNETGTDIRNMAELKRDMHLSSFCLLPEFCVVIQGNVKKSLQMEKLLSGGRKQSLK